MAASISTMTASIVATHNIGIGFCNADIFAIILIIILLIASLFIIGSNLIEDLKERYRKEPKIDKKVWKKYLKTAEKLSKK